MLDTAECDQTNSGYSGFFYNITELYDVKIPVSQLKNTHNIDCQVIDNLCCCFFAILKLCQLKK